MSPPNMEEPAPALAEGGLRNSDRSGGPISDTNIPSNESSQESLTARPLDRLRLNTWGMDLSERLWRRRMIFELCDFDVRFDDLVTEVEQFRRVCRALTWRAAP